MGRVRHPHRSQIPAPIASRQFLRVPAVRFDPIPRLHRHERRCHHVTVHTKLAQLPVEAVSMRSRFVANLQSIRRTQLLHKPPRLLTVGDVAQRPYVAPWLRNGYRDLLRIHIQAQMSDILCRLLSLVALRYGLSIASVTYELAIGAGRPIVTRCEVEGPPWCRPGGSGAAARGLRPWPLPELLRGRAWTRPQFFTASSTR